MTWIDTVSLLSGAVSVNLPCSDAAPMIRGDLSLTVASESVAIRGANARIAYTCMTETLSIDGSILSAQIGPAMFTDVRVSLQLSGPNLAVFSGTITGDLGSAGDLIPTGLPGLDTLSSDDSVSFRPTVSLTRDKKNGGFKIGKMNLAASFSKEIVSPAGLMLKMDFMFVGRLNITYPCETGDRITADVEVSGKVSDQFSIADARASMTYFCGALNSGTPRFAVALDVDNGAEISGLSVTNLHVEAFAYSSGAGGIQTGELGLMGKAGGYRRCTSFGQFYRMKS